MSHQFLYTTDWRVASAVYRHLAGTAELVRQERVHRLKHGFWLVVALGAALLATRQRLWLLVVPFVLLAAWQLIRIVLSFGLAKQAAFAMRESFRRSQAP